MTACRLVISCWYGAGLAGGGEGVEAQARALVERLAAESPWPMVYRHAPTPGVATARNAGLAATTAPLIAFLDDDEAAEPGWLSALADARDRLGADVVFGPIHGRAPDARPRATEVRARAEEPMMRTVP